MFLTSSSLPFWQRYERSTERMPPYLLRNGEPLCSWLHKALQIRQPRGRLVGLSDKWAAVQNRNRVLGLRTISQNGTSGESARFQCVNQVEKKSARVLGTSMIGSLRSSHCLTAAIPQNESLVLVSKPERVRHNGETTDREIGRAHV